MQKLSDNMFADKNELKHWALQLHNALGGQRAEPSINMSKQNKEKVSELCHIFVEQWNMNMSLALKKFNKEKGNTPEVKIGEEE